MTSNPTKLCLFRNYAYEDEGLPPSASASARSGRWEGSFRVKQRVALRATTAAPTIFKPVLLRDEFYVDGGVVCSNPAGLAVHEAKMLFPDTPIELVVSLGTGKFEEEVRLRQAKRRATSEAIREGGAVHDVVHDIVAMSRKYSSSRLTSLSASIVASILALPVTRL